MAPSGATPAGPREVLARFQQAAIDRDPDGMARLYAEDAVYEFPFNRSGVPARIRGRDRIRAFLVANWDSSPLHYRAYCDVVVHETPDPGVVVVEQCATGVSAATGRAFGLPHVMVLTVRDGRIAHCRDYVNVLAAAEAAGRDLL